MYVKISTLRVCVGCRCSDITCIFVYKLCNIIILLLLLLFYNNNYYLLLYYFIYYGQTPIIEAIFRVEYGIKLYLKNTN